MKTLYIMRHGKSAWHSGAEKDFDRPLNPRGQRDVPRIAHALHDHKAHPDIIISSPARRAITTARLLCASVQFPLCRIREMDSLYMAPLKTLTAAISGLDEKYTQALLVGHNPGLTHLINYFLGNRMENLPTAAVMGLEAGVDDWQAFVPGVVREKFFISPKSL